MVLLQGKIRHFYLQKTVMVFRVILKDLLKIIHLYQVIMNLINIRLQDGVAIMKVM